MHAMSNYSATKLFTRDAFLASELRALSYDVNSVTHFGARDFSKNGHRTILFKDPYAKQNRIGLSETDLRKIEIVYGPECRKRDRQEKIDLCQSYPGVARRKRDIDTDYHSTVKVHRRKRDIIRKVYMSSRFGRQKRDIEEVTQSLRINPDITPPPNITDVTNTLKELGIENAVQEIVDQVNKVSALALKNAREKYCTNKQAILRSGDDVTRPDSDVLGIIEFIANYAQGMVDNAVANLTKFCEESQSMDIYQRARQCSWNDGSERCRPTYRSTSYGARYSTNHRPIYAQSTKLQRYKKNIYARAGNDTDNTTDITRRKRDANTTKKSGSITNKKESVKHDKHEQGETGKREIKTEEDKVDKKAEEDKENVALRSRTYPGPGMNLYQAVRRSGRNRDRGKVEVESSVSIEADRPRKRKRPRTTEETYPQTTRDMKRGRKREIVEDDNGRNEERHMMKRPRQLQQKFIPKVVELSGPNIEFYKERKWPTGVVPYMIQVDTTYEIDDLRKRIEEVNSILKRKTCVRLQETTEEQAKDYEDYVVIDNSPDYVTGRVGGRQKFGSIELFRGGQHRQHAAMMVMALLGFYFEVARHDRDKHIRVHLRHVRPDKLHHFEKIRSDATLPLPYDYRSATHPAWQFWRQLGRTGISTVATYKQQDPDGSLMKSLGQNEKLLSDIDIVKINSVYGIKCFENDRDRKKIGAKPKNIKRRQNRNATVA